MPTMRIGSCSIAFALLVVNGAYGEDYPVRPVRIVTSEAGGGSDFVARLVAQGLSLSLGQPVIVDNRVGSIAPEAVLRATPDGYTVLVSGSTFWLAPLLRKTSYDPVKDFAPISMLSDSPNILVVHPSVPATTVKELIVLARARPKGLNYAGTTGASSHLAAELFKSMAGIDMVYVPYKGTGPALNDLLGGQVQVMFAVTASVMPHVKSGRLRAVAATGAKPSALVPDLPIVAATLPGFEVGTPYEMFAPSRVPAAIIKRLNREVVQLLDQPAIKGKFFSAGGEAAGGSPEQLAAKLRSDIDLWGKVVRNAALREY